MLSGETDMGGGLFHNTSCTWEIQEKLGLFWNFLQGKQNTKTPNMSASHSTFPVYKY